MDFFLGILLGIVWIGGIIFMRSITTFFHEMGHAIPALLFTRKEKVHVFVGTYGDISNCLQLNFGRLALYLKLNIFNWRIGLCTHGGIKGFLPQLIVILGGPIASLLIATLAFYFILHNNYSQNWIVLIVFFLISAIIDFIVNVDPSHTPIKLYDGGITYSDGYQLLRTIRRRGLPEVFFAAENLFQQKEYEIAIEQCLDLIEKVPQKKPVYDLVVKSFMGLKDYGNALNFYDSFKAIHPYNYIDFYQIGLLNLKLNRWDEALSYFDHCIYEKHTDGMALANRGYIHLQRGNYQRAQQDLEAAVFYAPDNPEAWNNRGLLKIKQNQLEGGFLDLQIAQKIAPSHPRIIYHIGIYWEKKRNFKAALKCFKEAKSLGLEYHGIDLKIAEVGQIVDAFL